MLLQDIILAQGFGINVKDIATNRILHQAKNKAYKNAMEDLLDTESEFANRVEDFNNRLYNENLPLLESAVINDNYYVYFSTVQLYDHTTTYNKAKLIEIIKAFIADALWSEYSANFDDANYSINEDTFVETAKNFVKDNFIHDIADYARY